MTKPTKPASGGQKKGRPDTDPKVSGTSAASPTTPGTAKQDGTRRQGNLKATGAKAGPNRAQSKKIVNQRQTPWGLIIATVLIVVLAVGVIGYALHQGKKKGSTASGNPDKIAGISHVTFSGGEHVNGVIKYEQSPPMGGPHAPVWADCTGTVYPAQIANENAVHDLEHGAIWITYKPGLAADQLDTLTQLVAGQPYMLLSPYDGLKTDISLQAWGYQLFVDSASDPRIKQFISDLKLSQTNTPELGASCTNSAFKTNPSTPGHPIDS